MRMHIFRGRTFPATQWLLLVISLLLVTAVTVASALTSSSSSTAEKSSSTAAPLFSTAPSRNKQCVIVGGGPVGLATALTLARPPHSYAKVTVLEQTAGETAVKKYDPTRSYLYNINPRGLDWFEQQGAPACAMEKLVAAGSAPQGAMGMIVIVPADPETPIPSPKVVSISGRIKLTNRTSYWIPRHQMVRALLECCNELNERKDPSTGLIEVLSGKHVDSILPDGDDYILAVHCKDGSVYTGALVVAADGIDSVVRNCLAAAADNNNNNSNVHKNSWLQSKAKSFRVKKYKSPSTGLKLKALQFPPNFVLPNSTTLLTPSQFQPESTTILAIRSVNKGSRNRISLGMLPMKDPHMVRPANTNTPFDHEIWSLHTGADAKAWFAKAFPRIRWDAVVDDAEWERFAQAKGTTFPHCQYSPGSAIASPDGMTGVVMVGDACHAFPPDIGQGINAGLQDVVALDRALRGVDIVTAKDLPMAKKPANLGAALETYQSNRGPEHAALIRLARFGAPFQYKQPWWRHRVGNLLWTANVVVRLLLNKLSFGVIPPAAIVIMVTDHSLTFRQVMRRADWTAFGLTFVSLACIFRAVATTFLRTALAVP